MTTNKPEVVAWLHSVRQDSDVITDKVRHVWGTPRGSMGEYTEPLIRLSDYEALQAECEELRKDAARYRWLRDANINTLPYDNHGMGPEFPYDDDLDAAIDDALTTHTLGEPECSHCGGTGDVSGEYPGIACPDCAGTGKAQHEQGNKE